MFQTLKILFVAAIIGCVVFVFLPTSHCDRISRAAIPAKLIGEASRFFVEVVKKESAGVVDDVPLQSYNQFKDWLTKRFYDRSNHAELCASDPIKILSRQGKLDDSLLVPLHANAALHINQTVDAADVPASGPAADEVAEEVIADDEEAPSGFFSGLRGKLLLVSLIVVSVIAAFFVPNSSKVFSAMLAVVKKLFEFHLELLSHLLPKSIKRPMPGKDKVDKTEN